MTTMPTIRGRLGTTNLGNASIPVNVPTDSTAPVVGDWMLVVINTVAGSAVVTPPSGWTQVLAATALGSRFMAVYRSVRASGDPNQYVFTQNTTGAAAAVIYYGVGVWGSSTAYVKGASGTTQTTAGVTTTVANTLALSLQAEATSATETDAQVTVASPFTKDLWYIQTGSSPVNSILVAKREMAAVGATGDAVSTWLNSTGNRGSMMALIHPAPDTTPTPTRLAGKMAAADGSVVNVGLAWWDGQAEVQLAKLETVYRGSTMAEVLAMSRVFTMAHRGGSLDYQEHCLRGYVQAAIAHVDIFEASVARTSDGEFVLAHDSTANRTTSGLPDNWKWSEHTAAEVRALVQDLPNRRDTRFTTQPYLFLPDFLAQWGKGSHSVFWDPKVMSTADRQAFYAVLQTVPNYQDFFYGKFYITGTAIADEFAAIGLGSWGYGYQDDVDNGNFAKYHAKWSMLGLDYSATQDAWNTVLGLAGQRKVIGHIVADLTQANTAVTKGAKGLQVSGVNAVSAGY